MKKLLLSGLLFTAMSSAALAAQPLTEQQMDIVTAGLTVLGPFTVQSLTVTPTTFRFVSEQFFIVTSDARNTPSFLQGPSSRRTGDDSARRTGDDGARGASYSRAPSTCHMNNAAAAGNRGAGRVS